jgi:hypothetical protein
MSILLVLLAIVLSAPILYTYAQNQSNQVPSSSVVPVVPVPTTVSGSISESINSFAILIGTIAPLIIALLAYMRTKTQDPKIQKAIDDATSVAILATTTANKTLENKQHIREALEVGVALAPEDARKALEANKAKIDQLNREIQATEAQLKRIVPLIPPEANADRIADLPRETPPSPSTRVTPPSPSTRVTPP